MKSKIAVLGSVLAVATIGIGALLLSPASAEDTQGETFFSRVAQILNIGESDLENAAKQAQIEQVQERVQAGQLDEERGNEIIERIQESEGFGFMRGGMQKGRIGYMKEHAGELAEFLGVTQEEMHEYHLDGKTLVEIAQEQGISEEEVKSFLFTEMSEHITQAYEDGRFDEARRDEMLANLDKRIEERLSGGFRGGMGGQQGMGEGMQKS